MGGAAQHAACFFPFAAFGFDRFVCCFAPHPVFAYIASRSGVTFQTFYIVACSRWLIKRGGREGGVRCTTFASSLVIHTSRMILVLPNERLDNHGIVCNLSVVFLGCGGRNHPVRSNVSAEGMIISSLHCSEAGCALPSVRVFGELVVCLSCWWTFSVSYHVSTVVLSALEDVWLI